MYADGRRLPEPPPGPEGFLGGMMICDFKNFLCGCLSFEFSSVFLKTLARFLSKSKIKKYTSKNDKRRGVFVVVGEED